MPPIPGPQIHQSGWGGGGRRHGHERHGGGVWNGGGAATVIPGTPGKKHQGTRRGGENEGEDLR
eukprot:2185725-Heterocapsa_arctica.AAC.1